MKLAELNPFKTADARRFATLFAIVYFAQGMWYLPRQPITIVLKDRGLSAGQVADFFFIATIPWLIKPLYGLISDFVPIFGYRRRSYFFLTAAGAAATALVLAATDLIKIGPISTATLPFGSAMTFTLVAGVGLYTAMGLALAFSDVLTDAMMVETGRPRGLTGAFQSAQWASLTLSAVLVGIAGGYLAGARNLRLAFIAAAVFPLVSLFMVARYVKETPMPADRAAFRATWTAITSSLGERDVWTVAGFILFFAFSPSFGPAFTYYQTDTLRFSQEFIGMLDSLAAVGQVVGALIFAPLSRRIPLTRVIVTVIGLSVAGSLGFLLYRGPVSAVIISILYGCFGIITLLAFLDLAAKACPRRVEATFFALLMSVYNGGTQLSENVGARLYDAIGFTPLILISAGATALAWLIVPLVNIDRIEAKAFKDAAPVETVSAPA
ncbi:MAG: MFS transporter [Candidatus Rokubacteria bacterium]|nr:MFS transporter [Candidatus Rokubacteria bacterium]